MIVNSLRRRFRLLFYPPSFSFLKGVANVKEVARISALLDHLREAQEHTQYKLAIIT
jgi:hypothetical protein